MIAPSLPLDEESRMERLRILGLLDREPIDQLDRLTRLITRHFSLPIAMVSLTDVNRQWFLARTGVALCEISGSTPFAATPSCVPTSCRCRMPGSTRGLPTTRW